MIKGEAMKALEILLEIDEVVTNKYHNTKTITLWENDIIFIKEAIAELEALQSKSCNGCKYGKFGVDSRGIEVECTLIWHCARGNGFPDRYEPKEK